MLKNLKVILAASALTGSTLLLTGFTWGFGKDKCSAALELAQQLPSTTDEVQRNKDETEIITLCPEGAAAMFVQGLQAEKSGDLDSAMAAYKRSLQQEPSLSAASGNLGILYQKMGLSDDAAVELTKALYSTPSPAYHTAFAKVMYERHFYSLALYHYGEALKKNHDDADAIAGQAAVYAAQGHTSRATDEYRRALLVNPAHEQAAIELSRFYTQQKQLDRAIDILEKAAAANPRNTKIHHELGDIYNARGDKQQAEYEWLLGGQKATISTGLQPATRQQHDGITRGDQLAKQGDVKWAIQAYQSTLAEQPDSVIPFERLGLLYMQTGQDEDAITAFREASYRNSTNPEVYYSLGLLYEKRDQLDEAIVSYKRAIERDPQYADAYLKVADLRLARGNNTEAIEQYVDFLKIRPERSDIQLKLADVYLKTNQLSYAENSYKEILKLTPENIEANKGLASIYQDKGENEKSIELYQKALASKNDDAETRSALTALYVKEKKYNELAALLQETVLLAPEDPNNHYKLGLIHDFNNDYEKAIESYKNCIELAPDHARALNALGRVYMKTGRLAEAREMLQAALKADPGLTEASVLLNNIQDDFNPVPRKLTTKKRPAKKVVKKKPAPQKAPAKKKR